MNEGLYSISHQQGGAVLTGQYRILTGLTNLKLYHSQARRPDIVLLQYLNIITDNGYTPGDEISIQGNQAVNVPSGLAIWTRPGLISTGDFSASNQYLNLKTSGSSFFLVQANWKVRLKALWFATMGSV